MSRFRLYLLTLVLAVQAADAAVVVTAPDEQQQQVSQPTWDATYTALPDATAGSPYSENLADYGVDVDDCHTVGTSRAVSESIWPAGLSLSTSTCVLSGTPETEDELAVVTVIGTNGTFDAAADWQARSSLSGVAITQDFPDQASVDDISSALSGNSDLSIWDSTTNLYGNGSLRQEIPDNGEYSEGSFETEGAVGAEANWRAPIIAGTWDNPTKMQVGDEVWVSYLLRFNRTEVQWPFAKRDDAGGGTQHVLKLGIVDEINTASSFESVLQSRWALFHGYTGLSTGLSWEVGFASACSGSDFRFQSDIDRGADSLAGVDPGLSSGSGAGSAWTSCQQDRARYGGLFSYDGPAARPDGFPDPITGAVPMPFDYWIAVQNHIKRETSDTTLIEWEAAPLGQDWTLMYSDTVATGGPYGVVNFTNSHTDMKAEPGVRPLSQRWYDGLITRTGASKIPAPGLDDHLSARTRFGIKTVASSFPAWRDSATESRWNTVPTVTSGDKGATLSAVNPEDDLSYNDPGTAGQIGMITGWNGGADVRGQFAYYIGLVGGHNSWYGNDVYVLDLNTESPGFERVKDPYLTPDNSCVSYFAANEPNPPHTYNLPVYIPPLSGSSNGDKMFHYARNAIGSEAGNCSSVEAAVFDFATNAYLAQGAWPDFPGGTVGTEGTAAWDGDHELVWMWGGGVDRRLYSFDPRTTTYAAPHESAFSGNLLESESLYIPGQDLLLLLITRNESPPKMRVYDVSTPSAPSLLGQTDTSGLPSAGGGGMQWEPIGEKVVFFNGGDTLYTADIPATPGSDTWAFSAQTNVAGGVDPGTTEPGNYNGSFGRFVHVPGIRAFVYVNNTTAQPVFWPIPAGGM